MMEIRSICTGLVLPHIEALEFSEILRLAISEYQHRTGRIVKLSMSESSRRLSTSEKICVYRFVQESLNNAHRHSEGSVQQVNQYVEANRQVIEVKDNGHGFDPANVRAEGLGLSGMRERVESVDGTFRIVSSCAGTTVTMLLSSEEFIES